MQTRSMIQSWLHENAYLIPSEFRVRVCKRAKKGRNRKELKHIHKHKEICSVQMRKELDQRYGVIAWKWAGAV